jgi:hypothetical protein
MDRRAVDAPLRRHHLLEDQRILLLQDLVALQIQRGVHIVVYQPSQDFKNGGCMELDPLEVRWASGATANPEAGTSPQEKQDGKNREPHGPSPRPQQGTQAHSPHPFHGAPPLSYY